MTRIQRILDIDGLLVFFLLAVTISQMGDYLATFAPEGQGFVGYLQAAGVDLAIWRSAWWYRRYTGKKQRRWALTGVVVFALVSTWYNRGFYHMQDPALPWWQTWLMGAILPAGVALLSYLKGQKDESKQFSTLAHDAPSEHKPEPATVIFHEDNVDLLKCERCRRVFSYPSERGGEYANRRAAQNAMNAHRCEKGEG